VAYELEPTALSANAEGCGGLQLQARALGEGPLDVTLDFDGRALRPTVRASGDQAVFRGLALSGSAELQGDETLRFWRQGYQSWSWAGVLEPGTLELGEDGLPMAGGDGDSASFGADDPGTSWWAGLLGRPGGASLLVGALSARTTGFYLAASDQGELHGVWGMRGDEIALTDGEELVLEPLRIALGSDANQLWDDYARQVAEQSPPRLTELPPTGWASWYSFYEDVTEDDVRANLAQASELAQGDLASLGVFQLDDGWQVAWGDWVAGVDFPSGTAALSEEIQAAGFIPGLWMAPFYVHRDTEAYKGHADWWVLDAQGEEIGFDNLGTGDYALLDATHPEAGPWMAAQVAARVAEGWQYLKLDFLYAGAQPGQRYADVTGMEAYHVGMQLLREAAGEAFVLACGAPMLPSVGYAEAFRTGADIAFGFDRDPRPEYLRWQARNTAGRAWMNGVWWWNDPDQLLVRDPLDAQQAQAAVAAQLASGGSWLLGDDLPALDEERLALALHAEAASLRGAAVRVAEPLRYVSGHDLGPVAELLAGDDQVPLVWQLDNGATALLNLSDEERLLVAPGGRELFSGGVAAGGPRWLEPWVSEVWLPR